MLPAWGVISAAAARTIGVPVETTSLLVTGTTITQAAEDRADEAVARSPTTPACSSTRYHDNSVAVALLILGVAGGALVLGGTLTATFLALSDARPDFATMGAIGTASRTRRMVAAAYALTVGLVGAVLGAAWFVPGHRGDLPAHQHLVDGAGQTPTRPGLRSPTTSSTCRGCWSSAWSSGCRCWPPSWWPGPPGRGCRWSAG